MTMSLCRLVGVTLGAATLFAVVTAPSASAASIVVSPSTAAPGATVTVSGDVLAGGQLGCAAPGPVTLISRAFAGLGGEVAGVPAVSVPVGANGHFMSTVHLSSSLAPGTYTISGRCGGGNLGVSATLTVRVLAATGVDTTTLVAVAVVLVGLGALARVVGSRHATAAH
jgi:hypothetical protein